MRHTMRYGAMLAAFGLLCGCGSDDGREGSNGPGIGGISQGLDTEGDTQSSATEATEGVGTGNATGQEGGTAADSSGGATKFDLGIQPDSNFVPEEGCTKVDFLFVIDNSGSMDNEQANLVNSFPGFISGIQGTLEQVDEYQVGVVTSDAYGPNGAGCNVLGGLVIETGGSYSSNANCGPYAAGRNYMTEADDLSTEFACAAQVGTSGSGIERPMDAMVAVVNKIHGGPGQCNEGFLRDDALLVIVIITDEWDGPNDPEIPGSSGTPLDWYNTVVAAKLGIPENAVALALINWNDLAGAPVPCSPASPPYDGQHIRDFVTLFGANGFLGGVCQPDYGPVFADAVSIIEDACNNFQPPG